jgi:hypothetical protein
MSIDPDTLTTVAGSTGAVGAGVVLYLLRAVAGLKSEFDDYRVKVAEQYANKTDIRELEERMDKRFDKIEAMLTNGSR